MHNVQLVRLCMEAYENIKWHYEFRTWLEYGRAMIYISYAVSHIAISITETHSTDDHIDTRLVEYGIG